MKEIRPILDKVLVEVQSGEEKTQGGLIVASKAKESEPIIGTVVARGPGGVVNGKEVKMCVEKGEKVVVNKYSGTSISMGGKEYKIVSQQDILACIL
ncbi:MAG: co-chaperone GroES [Clostridia bacterium]|jgi:chaperonin GroES|nr:co-chaperone GroES [Clostridia bacterium]